MGPSDLWKRQVSLGLVGSSSRNTCVEGIQTQPRYQEVLGQCPAELGIFHGEKEHLLLWLVIFLEIASRRKYRHVGTLNPSLSS